MEFKFIKKKKSGFVFNNFYFYSFRFNNLSFFKTI